jgi:glycosyltransferase involved in cell wall biosynthesis
MFFKIPIIAYNSTAVPSTLGDAGILINKKNYEEIAELMNVINSNTSLRNKIIRSENKRLKEFDKKKIGRKFIKILEDSL